MISFHSTTIAHVDKRKFSGFCAVYNNNNNIHFTARAPQQNIAPLAVSEPNCDQLRKY